MSNARPTQYEIEERARKCHEERTRKPPASLPNVQTPSRRILVDDEDMEIFEERSSLRRRSQQQQGGLNGYDKYSKAATRFISQSEKKHKKSITRPSSSSSKLEPETAEMMVDDDSQMMPPPPPRNPRRGVRNRLRCMYDDGDGTVDCLSAGKPADVETVEENSIDEEDDAILDDDCQAPGQENTYDQLFKADLEQYIASEVSARLKQIAPEMAPDTPGHQGLGNSAPKNPPLKRKVGLTLPPPPPPEPRAKKVAKTSDAGLTSCTKANTSSVANGSARVAAANGGTAPTVSGGDALKGDAENGKQEIANLGLKSAKYYRQRAFKSGMFNKNLKEIGDLLEDRSSKGYFDALVPAKLVDASLVRGALDFQGIEVGEKIELMCFCEDDEFNTTGCGGTRTENGCTPSYYKLTFKA